MEHDFWHDRWNSGRIAFHEPDGDPNLPARWSALGVEPHGRVLVTLCGKSRDMAWLASQGHAVVGVELSAIAARDYFAESGVSFAVEPRDAFAVYRSTQKEHDVTILVGDFFDLTAATLGEVHAVYDRAATVALPMDPPPELRASYAEHLASVLPAGTPMLLVTMEYDEARMSGPPFSIPDKAARALFEPGFTVDVMSEISGPAVAGRLRERGLLTLTERAYRLVCRG